MVSTPWFELKKTAYSTTYIKPSKIRFLLASQDLQCCRFANTICAYQTKDLPWSWNWQPTTEGKKSFYFLIIIKVGRTVTSPTIFIKCAGLQIMDSRLPVMMTSQIFFSPDKPRFWPVK